MEQEKRNEVANWIRGPLSYGNEASHYWYEIVAFIRGPDIIDTTSISAQEEVFKLKWATTARVRAIVGMDPRFGPDVNTGPLEADGRLRRDRLLGETRFEHFSRHWHSAVTAIREIYNYDLISERVWSEIVSGIRTE